MLKNKNNLQTHSFKNISIRIKLLCFKSRLKHHHSIYSNSIFYKHKISTKITLILTIFGFYSNKRVSAGYLKVA